MALPYENATTGDRAIQEIQKSLRAFGCTKFATGTDYESGEVFIQFEHRGRRVELSASARGYAAAWLRHNPWNNRRKANKKEHEERALEIGGIAVYSILRDWVKGQVTAIEIGVLTFESAFLSHLVLPNGRRVIEEIEARGMLPAPSDQEDSN